VFAAGALRQRLADDLVAVVAVDADAGTFERHARQLGVAHAAITRPDRDRSSRPAAWRRG
jgi:hypothetical protein